MPLCRVAWQALASRFARAAPRLHGHVPFRQMSSGSVPGSSGENWIGGLFVVGVAGAGLFYAYRVVVSDNIRYNERLEQMEQQRSKQEWKPKPWPPPSLESDETETKEVTDTKEEAKDATSEETEVIAGESQVQSEDHAESTESKKGEESPVEEATSGVPGEQNAPADSEATQDQG